MRYLFVIFVLVWPLAAMADFDAGLQAYERGDYEAAMREFLPLAEQGNAEAQFNLGLMYANGEGVPEHDHEAVNWFRKAADQGLAEAQAHLGFMYDNGEDVPEDDREAVTWYRKAAEQGVAEAQYNLALMYYNGEGVAKNAVHAYAWLNLAASQGDAGAVYAKGVIEARMTPAQIAEAQTLSHTLHQGISGGN